MGEPGAPKAKFNGKISYYDFTKYVYTCVYFPDAITRGLPLDEFPRLRIDSRIDGVSSSGALMPDRVGSRQTKHLLDDGYAEGKRIWYLQVPGKLLDELDKQIGDHVEVEFSIADQDEVPTHPTVEKLLEDDGELREIWEALTPGKRRTLMYPVLAAKTDPTLEKRLDVLKETLRDIHAEGTQ